MISACVVDTATEVDIWEKIQGVETRNIKTWKTSLKQLKMLTANPKWRCCQFLLTSLSKDMLYQSAFRFNKCFARPKRAKKSMSDMLTYYIMWFLPQTSRVGFISIVTQLKIAFVLSLWSHVILYKATDRILFSLTALYHKIPGRHNRWFSIWRDFYLMRDVWQCLKTFLTATMRELQASSE